MEPIQRCEPGSETAIRVYRALHSHQLKEYLHLPLLLRSSRNENYVYSRTACSLHARRLLVAYTYLVSVLSRNAVLKSRHERRTDLRRATC